ncbi:MAG: molybdate ABC transporter permease subunit, partial [Rhodoferax sp.]|nr:molybdate ABC transporter permease subunit [Rhodoferax sp.]
DKVKVALTVPSPKPVLYPIAPITSSTQAETAQKFVAFIQSAPAQSVLAQYGFGKPQVPITGHGLMQGAWVPLLLTLKVAGWSTGLNLLLGVSAGFAMARLRFAGREFLDAVLTLPMVMPPTVLGYYLLVLIGSRGPIGAWLKQSFGINLIFTWQAAVIAATIVAFPLVYKAARAAFETVEPQLEQAARVLGISEAGVFFRVSLPLAWRGILAGLLLAFARATGEFGATLMVAGSIAGKTQTLSIAVYEAVQAGQDDTANFLVVLTSVTCIAVLLAAGWLVPGRTPRQT